MLDIIRFILAAVLTAGGLFCLLSGVVGVYKFRYALSRVHAAALLDTVGILLMLLGVIIATGFTVASAKMLVVIAFLWLTSPVSGHLIGRMEVTINDELDKDAEVLDKAYVEHEKEPEAAVQSPAEASESTASAEEEEVQ
ncbi:MAG: monovalent cation/H(+) antiporter subunit G [Clostridiales bacterium]|nr:monovalent cation/H(+) antiporter subunit G [Clostridiales bacterium]